MIIAVGVDMVEIARVGRLVVEHGDRFVKRVFTPDEIALSEGKDHRLAGRFAAKEAVLKVLRTGLDEGISWQEVSIASGPRREPLVVITGRAESIARSQKIDRIHVSISHDQERAVAMAVGESLP
jgi:holo-[acyl-carrier protein] synthase